MKVHRNPWIKPLMRKANPALAQKKMPVWGSTIDRLRFCPRTLEAAKRTQQVVQTLKCYSLIQLAYPVAIFGIIFFSLRSATPMAIVGCTTMFLFAFWGTKRAFAGLSRYLFSTKKHPVTPLITDLRQHHGLKPAHLGLMYQLLNLYFRLYSIEKDFRRLYESKTGFTFGQDRTQALQHIPNPSSLADTPEEKPDFHRKDIQKATLLALDQMRREIEDNLSAAAQGLFSEEKAHILIKAGEKALRPNRVSPTDSFWNHFPV